VKKGNLYFVAACLLLLGAGFAVRHLGAETKVPLAKPLDKVPFEFLGVTGCDVQPNGSSRYDTTANNWIIRKYASEPKIPQLSVYVGYWENQNEGKGILSPRYTRDGWSFYWIRKKQIVIPSESIIYMTEFLNEKGSERELTYYSYLIGGRFIADENHYRLMRMINAVLHGRSNAGLVRITIPVTDDFPLDRAETYAESFLKGFLPIVKTHFPY
jgi:EpsI family protein